MPTRVLLSIKPRFAEAILSGQKIFEFRRTLFRRRDIDTVVVYASSPTSQVVGDFKICEVLQQSLDALWVSTRVGGGISREFFDEYFAGRSEGYALKVASPRRYGVPLRLHKDLGISHPPQSFRYID